MAVSRRRFLQHGVLTAAACAGSPLLAFTGGRPIGGKEAGEAERPPAASSQQPGSWQDHAAALDHLGRNAFAAEVGTNFKVVPADKNALPVWVTLVAVNDLPKIAQANAGSFAVPNRSSSVAPATSGFVLVFGGSSALPQATHLFAHDALGRFALFTVPAGNGQQLYTAVVNRLDSPPVIAVPFSQVQAGRNNAITGAPASAVKASPATSSGNETPSPGLSGTPGVRRGAVRD